MDYLKTLKYVKEEVIEFFLDRQCQFPYRLFLLECTVIAVIFGVNMAIE